MTSSRSSTCMEDVGAGRWTSVNVALSFLPSLSAVT